MNYKYYILLMNPPKSYTLECKHFSKIQYCAKDGH